MRWSERHFDDWDRLGRDVPTFVDLMPSGCFLMQDFYCAGGLPAVIRALEQRNLIHRDAPTINRQLDGGVEDITRKEMLTAIVAG